MFKLAKPGEPVGPISGPAILGAIGGTYSLEERQICSLTGLGHQPHFLEVEPVDTPATLVAGPIAYVFNS